MMTKSQNKSSKTIHVSLGGGKRLQIQPYLKRKKKLLIRLLIHNFLINCIKKVYMKLLLYAKLIAELFWRDFSVSLLNMKKILIWSSWRSAVGLYIFLMIIIIFLMITIQWKFWGMWNYKIWRCCQAGDNCRQSCWQN